MLKFARNSRSSSTERSTTSGVPQRSRIAQLQKQNTRDFSPVRFNKGTPTFLSEETPRTSRSSSAERVQMRSRRQLSFDRENPSPRMISAQRQVQPHRLPSPPPAVKDKTEEEEDTVLPALPPRLPQRKFPVESDYKEVSSGTYCRLKNNASLAPLTPTLEKLSHPHIAEGLKPIQPPPKSVLKNSNKYDFHRAVERLVEKLDLHLLDTSSESGYGSDDHDSLNSRSSSLTSRTSSINSNDPSGNPMTPPPPPPRIRPTKQRQRVHFDSYVMLLQGIREKNLELVQKNVTEVCQDALATEEVMLEFVRAVIDGQEQIVMELLTHGLNPNFGDPSGLTPLHFAAAFNNLPLIKLLVTSGAAIFPRAHSSGKTPVEMCSLTRPGFQACHAYLRCIEECLGVSSGGRVFVVRPYRTCRSDELCVQPGEELKVLRKGDYGGSAWWWCTKGQSEGYVLKDLLTLNKPNGV